MAAAHAGARDGRPPARVPVRRVGRRASPASSCSFPHYLGDTEYPGGHARRARQPHGGDGPRLHRRRSARGEPRVPRRRSTSRSRAARSSRRMVQGLEERYDAYMAGIDAARPRCIHTGDLPSADELAAELERFLATRPPPTTTSAAPDAHRRCGRNVPPDRALSRDGRASIHAARCWRRTASMRQWMHLTRCQPARPTSGRTGCGLDKGLTSVRNRPAARDVASSR